MQLIEERNAPEERYSPAGFNGAPISAINAKPIPENAHNRVIYNYLSCYYY